MPTFRTLCHFVYCHVFKKTDLKKGIEIDAASRRAQFVSWTDLFRDPQWEGGDSFYPRSALIGGM